MTQKSKAGRDNTQIGGDSKKIINISNNVLTSAITTIALLAIIVGLMKQNQWLAEMLFSIKIECPEPTSNLQNNNIDEVAEGALQSYTNDGSGSILLVLGDSREQDDRTTNLPKWDTPVADYLQTSNNPEFFSDLISDSPYPTRDFVVSLTEVDYLKSEFSLNPIELSQTNLDNSTVVKKNNIFSKDLSKAVNTDRAVFKMGFSSIENWTGSLSNQETVTNNGVVSTLFDSHFNLVSTNNSNQITVESLLEDAGISKTKKVSVPDTTVPDVVLYAPIVQEFAINEETSDMGSDSKSESKSIPEHTSVVSLLMLAILGGISRLKRH